MATLPGFDDDRPDQAARLAPRLRALADRGIYLGTSSWKYEGWLGSIYTPARYQTRGKHSKAKFERECLAEYAETFPTACGDFAFYQFPSEEYWAGLFEQVPAGFLFGFKVPEDITVARWPTHARYGNRAGGDNEHFLDAKAFGRFFAKRLEPYAEKVGPLIFEFGTFNKSTFPTPDDFYDRLGPFLDALPGGSATRSRSAITSTFRRPTSTRSPAAAWPTASTPGRGCRRSKIRRPCPTPARRTSPSSGPCSPAAGPTSRRSRHEPYREIQEPDESARRGMATIAGWATPMKPAFLFVNNRLEGNAPSTIEAVAASLGHPRA